MRGLSTLALSLLAVPALADDLRTVSGTAILRERIALPQGADLRAEARGLRGALMADSIMPGAAIAPFALDLPAGVPAAVSVTLAAPDGAAPVWSAGPVAVAAGSGPVALGDLVLLRDDPGAPAQQWLCGGQAVRVSAGAEGIVVAAGGDRLAMAQVPAASGAKYGIAGDETTWFWDHGGEAMFALRGDATGCIPAPPVTWAAAGEGWSLTVTGTPAGFLDGADWRLTRGDTVQEGRFAAPVWETGAAVWTAGEGGPVVRMIAAACATGPETVEVTMGQDVLDGCGGDVAGPPVGVEWVVEDIGGAGLIDSSRVTLVFGADGRVAGSGGCNRWFGGYAGTGAALTIGDIGATRMACPPALMMQEQRFFEALSRVAGFAIDDTGALRLTDAAGGVLILARRG